MEEYDLIVILSGTCTPGYNFPKNRIDKGIELYKKMGYDVPIIISGVEVGNLKKFYEDYLKSKGVEKGSILFETKSRNTVENAYFTKKYLEANQRKLNRIALVTDETHAPRALSIFKMVFGKDYEIESFPAPSGFDIKQKIKMYLHEKLGIIQKNVFLLGVSEDEKILQRYDSINSILPIRKMKSLISKLYGK